MSETELTCYHEAGHAAVRDCFKIEIGELWVNEGRGNCRFRVPDRGDIGLLQDIIGSLAGRIAEGRAGGCADDEESSGDYQRAYYCALRLSGGDEVGAELLLQWAERRTALLVEELWPQIHQLAYRLLIEGRLSGEQVAMVLREDTQ